jgi:hypothetical protein
MAESIIFVIVVSVIFRLRPRPTQSDVITQTAREVIRNLYDAEMKCETRKRISFRKTGTLFNTPNEHDMPPYSALTPVVPKASPEHFRSEGGDGGCCAKEDTIFMDWTENNVDLLCFLAAIVLNSVFVCASLYSLVG